MALEYDLHVSSRLKPSETLERLVGQLSGLLWSEDRSFLLNESVQVDASEPLALTKGIIKDAFHFTPTLRVGFRRSREADWDTFRQFLLEAALLLLQDAQDAVLLFNGEIIVLQRFGGTLVLNSEYDMGGEDWLRSRLTVPFEFRPLPSPLL